MQRKIIALCIFFSIYDYAPGKQTGSDKSKTKELQIDFSVQKKLDTVTKDLDDPAIREKAVEKKMQKKIMKRTSKIESGERIMYTINTID